MSDGLAHQYVCLKAYEGLHTGIEEFFQHYSPVMVICCKFLAFYGNLFDCINIVHISQKASEGINLVCI